MNRKSFLTLQPRSPALELGSLGAVDRFAVEYTFSFPSHRISGVGVDRGVLSQDVLQVRTDLMIQAADLWDHARAGGYQRRAPRSPEPKLQAIIQSAAESSGFPGAHSRGHHLSPKAGAIPKLIAPRALRATCRSPIPPRTIWA